MNKKEKKEIENEIHKAININDLDNIEARIQIHKISDEAESDKKPSRKKH